MVKVSVQPSSQPVTPRSEGDRGGALDPNSRPPPTPERALRTLALQSARTEAYNAGKRASVAYIWDDTDLLLLGGDYLAGVRQVQTAPPVREYPPARAASPVNADRGSASGQLPQRQPPAAAAAAARSVR